MSYVNETYTGEEAKKLARRDGRLDPQMADKADSIEKLELVSSSFSDPGPDWNEWRAYSSDGSQISTRRMDGY